MSCFPCIGMHAHIALSLLRTCSNTRCTNCMHAKYFIIAAYVTVHKKGSHTVHVPKIQVCCCKWSAAFDTLQAHAILSTELQLEIRPERWINKQVQRVLMNTTQHKLYTAFAWMDATATIILRFGKMQHLLKGGHKKGCSVYLSKYGTYVYTVHIMGINTVLCVLFYSNSYFTVLGQ